MKIKTFTFAAIAMMVGISSHAALNGISLVGSYEQSSLDTAPTLRTYKLGGQTDSKFGTFDLQVVHVRSPGSTKLGVEAGYGNFVNVGPIVVNGRVGLTRIEGSNTAAFSAVGSLPVGYGLKAFVGGKHVEGFGGTQLRLNQLSAGLSTQLRQNLVGSVGVNRNYVSNAASNSLSVGLGLKF